MGNSSSSSTIPTEPTGAAPTDTQVKEVYAALVSTYQDKIKDLQRSGIDEELLFQRLRAKLQETQPSALGVARIDSDITGCINQTPIVKIRAANAGEGSGAAAEVVAKVEFLSPGFSVKDRIALSMVEDAEMKGLIKPGETTVIDITSGNTGVGLGVVCAAKGYKCLQIIPEPFSVERRALMMALGVEVVVTPMAAGIGGALKKYCELLQSYGDNGWSTRQFDNFANIEAHLRHTGPEIWEQCGGKIDAIVAGYGTGGTISGVTSFLRQKNPSFKAICVEPMESSLLNGDNPGPHGIQGLAPPFVPDNVKVELVDEVIRCPTAEALNMARALAQNEGILCGISAGANVWAALQVAKAP